MLFHMVAFVLLSMAVFSNIFLLVEILQQSIIIFEISGYQSSVAILGWTELAKYRILQEEQNTNTAPF